MGMRWNSEKEEWEYVPEGSNDSGAAAMSSDTSSESSKPSAGWQFKDGKITSGIDWEKEQKAYKDEQANLKIKEVQGKVAEQVKIQKTKDEQLAYDAKTKNISLEEATAEQDIRESGNIFQKIGQGVEDTWRDVRKNTTGYNYKNEVAIRKPGEDDKTYQARQTEYAQNALYADKEQQSIKEQLVQLESEKVKLETEVKNMPNLTFEEVTQGKKTGNMYLSQKKDLESKIEKLKEMDKVYSQYLGQTDTNRDVIAAITREFNVNNREGKIPLIGAIPQIDNALKMNNAVERMNKGETLTKDELFMVQEARAKLIEQRLDYGYGATIGSVMANAPTFAVELAMTGGLANVGKAGVTKVVGAASEKMSVEALAKGTLRAMVGEVTRLPAYFPKIANKTVEYALPKYDVVAGKNGDAIIEKLGNGDAWDKAFAKAVGTTYIENVTESAGALIENGAPILKKAVVGMFLKKVEEEPLKYGLKEGTKITANIATDLLKKMQVQGLFAEIFEEELGEPFQAAIEGRQYNNPLTTAEGRNRLLLETIGITFLQGMYQIPAQSVELLNKAHGKYESTTGKPDVLDLTEFKGVETDPVKLAEMSANDPANAQPPVTDLSTPEKVQEAIDAKKGTDINGDGKVSITEMLGRTGSSEASNAALETITQSDVSTQEKIPQLETLVQDIQDGKYTDDVADTTLELAQAELDKAKSEVKTTQSPEIAIQSGAQTAEETVVTQTPNLDNVVETTKDTKENVVNFLAGKVESAEQVTDITESDGNYIVQTESNGKQNNEIFNAVKMRENMGINSLEEFKQTFNEALNAKFKKVEAQTATQVAELKNMTIDQIQQAQTTVQEQIKTIQNTGQTNTISYTNLQKKNEIYGTELASRNKSPIQTVIQNTEIVTPAQAKAGQIISTPEGRATAINQPLDSLGKIKQSKAFTLVSDRFQKEIEANQVEEPTYRVANIAETVAKGIQFAETNPEVAKRIAMGLDLPPEGMSDTAISMAVSQAAFDRGDTLTAAQVEKSLSLRRTRGGQENAMLRGRKNDNSPEYFIKQVLDARLKMAEKSNIFYKIATKAGGAKVKVMERIDMEARIAQKAISKAKIKLQAAQELLDQMTC